MFASTFVQFSNDTGGDFVDTHVVLARTATGKRAAHLSSTQSLCADHFVDIIIVRPRARTFSRSEGSTYSTTVEEEWEFTCREVSGRRSAHDGGLTSGQQRTQTVQWDNVALGRWAALKFTHRSEFWRFACRLADARISQTRRDVLIAERMTVITRAVRSLARDGRHLTWMTFHSTSSEAEPASSDDEA